MPRRGRRRSARLNRQNNSEYEENTTLQEDIEENSGDHEDNTTTPEEDILAVNLRDPEEFNRLRNLLQNMSYQEYVRLNRGLHPRAVPPATPAVVTHPRRRPSNLQIPVFEARRPGNEDYVSIQAFLKTVERETRIGDYDDMERIVVARDYIRGSARVKFDNAGLMDEMQWPGFCEKAKEVFAVPRTEVVSKLHSLTILRKPRETLDCFIERVSAALNNYSKTGVMEEEEKLTHLTRILQAALPPGMGYPLLKPISCKSLVDDVVGYAETHPQHRMREADISQETTETTKTVVAAIKTHDQQTSDASDNYYVPETVQQYYGNPVNFTRGRGIVRGRGSVRIPHCNGCGGNHPRSTCVRSHNVTCYNCGIVGHLSAACRKNGRAATEPSPVATTNFSTAPPRPRYTAPPYQHLSQRHQQPYRQPRYTPPLYRPRAPLPQNTVRQTYTAPQSQFRAPQLRPSAPIPSQAAHNPMVAATSLQYANPGFPWQPQPQQPQYQMPSPPPQQQQQQQQQQRQQQE